MGRCPQCEVLIKQFGHYVTLASKAVAVARWTG